ncbi:hypothetical protein ACHQM5_017777 [Ranunculus cassubicifolius]
MLAKHKDYTDSSLNYASGQTTSAGAGQSTTLKRAHGALCLFGWGILLWIGIMAARYLNEMDPFWFYCHLSLQSLVLSWGYQELKGIRKSMIRANLNHDSSKVQRYCRGESYSTNNPGHSGHWQALN